jgi:hypothetical protein
MSSIFEALEKVDKKKAEQEADSCIAATGQLLFDKFLKENGEDKRTAFMAGLKAALTAAFASNQIKEQLTGSRDSSNQAHGAAVGNARFEFKSAEMRDKFQQRVKELAKELGAEVSDLNQSGSTTEAEYWLNKLMFGRRRPSHASPFTWPKNNGSDRPSPEPAAPAASGTATTEPKPADPVAESVAPAAQAPLPSDTELSE